MKKISIVLMAIALVACASLPNASVVLSKAKTVTALLSLENSAMNAYREVINDVDVFSDQDAAELKEAWQNLVDFRLSLQRLGKRENIALSVQDFTARLTTVRGEISRIAIVIDKNYASLSPQSKAAYVDAIGLYNRINVELDNKLAQGENAKAVELFIFSVQSAAAMASVFDA